MLPSIIRNVASELNEKLQGGVVSKIQGPTEKTILLKIYTRGRRENLLISTEPKFSRIHLAKERYENPPLPLRFCAFLRSRLEDAKIKEIKQFNNERIAQISLEKRAEKEVLEYTLVIELTGRSGNVILVDKEGVVLDALRYFHPKDSKRTVLPGIKLMPLPMPETITDKEKPFLPKKDETWSEAIERHYSKLISDDRFISEKMELKHAITAAGKKAEKKLSNLMGDKKKAEEERGLGRFGELLLLNFKMLKKGMDGITVEDVFSAPSETVNIPLDKKLSPQENIDSYFKRSKKAKTSLSLLKGRIPQVQGEIEHIKGLMDRVEGIEDEKTLERLSQELASGGYLKKGLRHKPDKKYSAEPIRRHASSDGFEILWGKSGKANDLLLRDYARDGDIWLHAKGVAGSHVVVKARGRKKPSEEAIRNGAKIAAFYSKGGTSSKLDVLYTDVKNVKKPKGAKPGTVVVDEYKTIMVRPEDVTKPK